MHAVLLTLIALSGADGGPPHSAMPPAARQVSAVTYPGSEFAGGCSSCGSAACNGAGCGYGGTHYDRRVNRQLQRYMSGRPHGPMPQTCYAPRFGCYHGNDRHMHRYPAFHGTYYRRPYNYRNLFEYPWHAEMHEPTSYFSYNVPPEANNGAPLDAPPVLPPEAATQHRALPAYPHAAPAQPVTEPIFAPLNKSAAAAMPEIGQGLRVLPPPMLNDNDLAGVGRQLQIDDQRIVPAPIEALDDATPYSAGGAAPVAFAPRVASRPLSSNMVMLQPTSDKPEGPARGNGNPDKAAAPAEMPSPQLNVKPISLGTPLSLPPSNEPESLQQSSRRQHGLVSPATAEEDPNQPGVVRATTATEAIEQENALREEVKASAEYNPLRIKLRR